jgi:uncharacterized protein YggE
MPQVAMGAAERGGTPVSTGEVTFSAQLQVVYSIVSPAAPGEDGEDGE